VPFSNGNTALINNLYWFKKYSFLENTGRIFEGRLQQGKSGNVINTDLRNIHHQPKAWDCQTEAYTHWKKRDRCRWNGKLAKPQRPETNISFNTPNIQKKDLTK